MLILVDDVTNVKTSSNHLKFRNYQASWKIVKNDIKVYKTFFLHKIKNNVQQNQEWNFGSNSL